MVLSYFLAIYLRGGQVRRFFLGEPAKKKPTHFVEGTDKVG